MTGIIGLKAIDDIISLLDKWQSGTGGKKPTITKVWKKKNIGHGNKGYDEIVVILDAENPNIFSLKRNDNSDSNYDWLHDVSLSMDVWSSKSEERADEMANEVARLLKSNVLFNENNNQYVQLLPSGFEPLHDQYRNIFRWVIDCELVSFNP